MAKAGFKNGIDSLLREGVDVNIRDRWGRTALQVIVVRNSEIISIYIIIFFSVVPPWDSTKEPSIRYNDPVDVVGNPLSC